ncbi:MAG: hypothetical protein Kow0056_12130 [Coriobacteriia bacterium]
MSVPTVVSVIALIVALAALGSSIALGVRLRAMTRKSSELDELARQGDFLAFAEEVSRRVGALEEADAHRRADDEALAARLARAVRHVGLVRYDAFENTAGGQSFSLALLDDAGDGVVITSIYGRDEYRVYAKPVRERAARRLTQEEQQAIDSAFGGGSGID